MVLTITEFSSTYSESTIPDVNIFHTQARQNVVNDEDVQQVL